MRASTELLLWELFSFAGELFRPSFRYSNESSEAWAARNGMLRQLQRLEAEAFLERQPGGKADRIYRLTPKGRLAALGGKDPEMHWSRAWDGRWRLLMFDLPASPQAPRARLRTVLREHGLGCLQGSVWLSPHPLDEIRNKLSGDRHPSSLLLFEGRTTGHEAPSEMVHEGWDFGAIRRAWAFLANSLERGKKFLSDAPIDSEAFKDWAALEQSHWKQILEIDPFLPAELLPRHYPGRKLWKERLALRAALGNRLRNAPSSARQKN